MTIPLLMLASKIDFTEPSSVLILRAGYFGVVLLQVAVFWYIKQLVAAKNDQTKIWVTNEAPMQPKTVVETTYVALETERAQQGVQQAFTGALIMSLLHFQMGINQPLVRCAGQRGRRRARAGARCSTRDRASLATLSARPRRRPRPARRSCKS